MLSKLGEHLGGKKERLQWIKATFGQNLRLIPVDEVLFFQSDEKYTRVVTAESEALIKTPIRELIDGLDPEVFWQIHRSTLVNVNAIARGHARFPRPGPREDQGQGRVPGGLAHLLAPVQADVIMGWIPAFAGMTGAA